MKKFLIGFLIMIIMVSVTGCGGETVSETNEPIQNDIVENTYDKNNLDSILDAMETEYEAASQYFADETTALIEKFGETYDGYHANKEAVTKFYEDAASKADTLYKTVQTYSIDYFKCVASDGIKDYDTWNDALDDFYDAWNDGMDDFYDAWNDCYEDLYEECDDLIEDGQEQLSYSEYSDIWSAMYEEASDAWSAMYEKHSDAWSKTYDDCSNVWSGFYNGESDVDKILAEAEKEAEENKKEENEKDTTSGEDDAENTELVDGMRPEFKQAMDSYEAFYDEYCEFMKKFYANPTDRTLLAEYTDMLETLAEMDEEFADWGDEDLNSTELTYYLEVTNRITQKLLEVTES